ncbi:uncharacterized protein K452DRAFT_340792 [Aplosporella prunicola CBS 121167]|uniref:Uncharacterized protein n=1 Tax=Aplosporella prunicola CBS 121167 TaxID=1176127 RepID=A0A6A6BSH3_9PEZI|nr:uncharacterized protein K452DRAFT_340792 [Aplosporella prunicola CBS 121167]KAF2146184.1 hypothetical protein K452DRAFT_340792 [Aplosporella prunicola CBS 121167]
MKKRLISTEKQQTLPFCPPDIQPPFTHQSRTHPNTNHLQTRCKNYFRTATMQYKRRDNPGTFLKSQSIYPSASPRNRSSNRRPPTTTTTTTAAAETTTATIASDRPAPFIHHT